MPIVNLNASRGAKNCVTASACPPSCSARLYCSFIILMPPLRVDDRARTRWGQVVHINAREQIGSRWYCTYEYGLGGTSEGAAYEDHLFPVCDQQPVRQNL